MSAAPCYCCQGTGIVDPDRRPLCATAIQRRDTRSPRQLASIAWLQRFALVGVAFDDDGDLLSEHGEPYVDFESGEVRA